MLFKLEKIKIGNLIFWIALCFLAQKGLAQEVPFDANSPQGAPDTTLTNPNTPDSTNSETSSPNSDELKTPPELELAPVPLPQPKAQKEVTNTKPELKKKASPAELAALGKLSSFEDIAVISKRYLPKTNRFEFFPNIGLVLNDAFFNDIIFQGRLAYYLSETYGLEVTGMSISSSNKQVTTELATNRAVGTQALATPTAYFGADFKWSPIYGKVAWLNESIIPFDFYFSGGGGITQTNQGTSPPTLHLGAGQLFAIKKWLAFRWDLSWYGYQTTTNVTNKPSGTYTNLHATIGISLFFPSAGYR